MESYKTNKNMFFLVRFGFYWFLNDAERYSSIYVDVLSYKGFDGTIADNHKVKSTAAYPVGGCALRAPPLLQSMFRLSRSNIPAFVFPISLLRSSGYPSR